MRSKESQQCILRHRTAAHHGTGQPILAALDWLCASQDACKTGGSAAYYVPFWGWFPPYPETTGYIITTLLRAAVRYVRPDFAVRALRMGEWLLTLQTPEGAFPAGLYRAGRPGPPSVFNTAQIIFGLCAAYEHSKELRYREAAQRAASWLVREQDHDGRWRKHAYQPGFSPSYYAHVCLPLTHVWKHWGDGDVLRCVERGLVAILSDRLENGAFRNWGFRPDTPAFTHTIGYTLQGLLECARHLDAWDRFGAPAADSCARLMRRCEIAGRIAGSYDENWKGDFRFACLTGHCQLASAWLRVYEHDGDPRFLNLAVKALDEVTRRQRHCPNRLHLHGAIAGSYPIYGRYLTFRYPNWAAKFFIDAMMDVDAHLVGLAAGSEDDG